jgi:hypothetical protein
MSATVRPGGRTVSRMLPESLDPSDLRTIALVVVVVVALVALMVMRFIQKMVLRVILIGALAGIGITAWWQRAELQDCVPECACTFFGMDVPLDSIPGCRATEAG